MNVRDISIKEIGLSVRAFNALRRAGVNTVGELLDQTRESLSGIRNLGAKSIDEILQKIEEYKAYDAEGGLPEQSVSDVDKGDTNVNVRDISIKEIGLSVRAFNALRRAGVNTVGELLGQTWESLSEIRNLGAKSIDEVLEKIEEYRALDTEGDQPEQDDKPEVILPDVPEDYAEWAQTEEGKDFIRSWIKENDIKIGVLELLSARAYNHLLLNGYTKMHQIAFMTAEDLMQIPRMDPQCAGEIADRCRHFLEEKKDDILTSLQGKREAAEQNKDQLLRNMLQNKAYHDRILQFAQANDAEVDTLDLSFRARSTLKRQGCFKISDFLFLTRSDLSAFRNIGTKTVDEVMAVIDAYMAKNETRIRSVLGGEDSVIWDDAAVAGIIDDAFNRIGFGGYSLQELREKERLPEQITDEQLKRILGTMIAEGKLEYVDFRCYRVYPKFEEYLASCPDMDDRAKDFIRRRLAGETLESIAAGFNLTRERVRQIISKEVKNVKRFYQAKTGLEWFDEDYYRYFFETYSFDRRDAEEWLGINREIFNYLDLSGSKRGEKNLEEALDDSQNLDYGFRLRIKNYLNRNKLFLDGRWVEKKRADLEEYVVRKYCTETVSYEEFIRIYNDFLRSEEIPYDESIYYTDAVKRTRMNKLSADRSLLWKQNRQIRYYDIDGRDYTELLDALNLDAYENVEYSTLKFIREYPEIMEQYDIRDQYELHNLLRKIVPQGSYHDFCCEKNPTIRFGTPDMNSVFMDLMIDNAPISQTDLAELISKEYGFEPGTVMGSYLAPLSPYYHQGMYTIDQKAMLAENREKLLDHLDDDFYYMDEIRKLYASLIPGADLEEINPYNLKTMGFSVLSRYVYRNYSSLEAYFRNLLTREDITDITPYRRRFVYVNSFSSTLVDMKNDYEILEFEPNQIIRFRKLEAAGVTKDDLQAFCDEAANFVEDGTYFSMQSIKKTGFQSELFDLGFSDWFYASLLTADDRFSFTKAFGAIILYKGEERITIQSFEEQLIKEHSTVDVYDLMTEMEETYGCQISDHVDVIYKVKGTDVYYDPILDRLYANTAIYNRELDAAEGM